MSKTNDQKWTDLCASGRGRFVLRYGILGWGISTAVLFTGLQYVHDGWPALVTELPIALVLFPLAGMLWGRSMWWFLERMHKCSASERHS